MAGGGSIDPFTCSPLLQTLLLQPTPAGFPGGRSQEVSSALQLAWKMQTPQVGPVSAHKRPKPCATGREGGRPRRRVQQGEEPTPPLSETPLVSKIWEPASSWVLKVWGTEPGWGKERPSPIRETPWEKAGFSQAVAQGKSQPGRVLLLFFCHFTVIPCHTRFAVVCNYFKSILTTNNTFVFRLIFPLIPLMKFWIELFWVFNS